MPIKKTYNMRLASPVERKFTKTDVLEKGCESTFL